MFKRPKWVTQCCTQIKSTRDTILCLLFLHYFVEFTFKCYGNYWNKTLYPLRVWIRYNWVSRLVLLKLWEIWNVDDYCYQVLWQEVAERTNIILNVRTSFAGCFLVVGNEYPFHLKLLRFMKRNAAFTSLPSIVTVTLSLLDKTSIFKNWFS